MLIRSEFNIQFSLSSPTSMVALLHLHPSLEPLLRSGNELLVENHPTLAFGRVSYTKQLNGVDPLCGIRGCVRKSLHAF